MNNTDRAGGWIQTYTGKQFFPFDPRPEDIDIRDIAHALSCIPRFSGHTREFYSVAQHSVLVSQHCALPSALSGLLHDASEAYLLDLPTPIKHMDGMFHYREAELRCQQAICSKFDTCYALMPSVHHADQALLATEAAQLLGPAPVPWARHLPEPLPIIILPLSPTQAELAFRMRWQEITGQEMPA
jgi:hypothetical protein